MVNIENKTFCFTGQMASMRRIDAFYAVAYRGGNFLRHINRNVDYLVVGNKGNKHYKYSSFGRKYKTAVDYQDKFGKPVIIEESDFINAISAVPEEGLLPFD